MGGLFNEDERKLYNAEQDVIQATKKAMTAAMEVGQGVDSTKLKKELQQNLVHTQEGYEFLKVLMNRHSSGFNKLDHDTYSYISCAMRELEKVEGLKK